MPTHIDLFAGIGGFSLGFENAGIDTLAHVEIDEKCKGVLRNHWGDHLIFSDVCEVGKHNLPYADIITFGSPCQDLSIAGKRKGFADGTRSNLFFEAVRIIREIEPRYAVWENVPGALSSHDGRDFQSVIESLLDTDIPMPKSGRWASSGMVRTGQKEVAWRILDAQYFGVAQRRRRVFLIYCAGNGSPSSILFEREGVRWDTPPRRKAGEEVAYTVRSSPSHSGDKGDGGINTTLITGTLDGKCTAANRGSQANEAEFIVAFNIHQNDDHRKDRPNGGLYVDEAETGLTLQTGQGKSHTVVMAHGQANAEILEDQSSTLNVNHEQPIAFTTRASASRGNIVPLVGVRRLTPTECERLQGFPDGWTAGQSDSTRYKQLGNAVAVPVAEWIGRRIMEL